MGTTSDGISIGDKVSGSSLSILVVDDEEFMRELVCSLLRDLGYRQLIEAASGKEGLDALAATTPLVGLVLLDIQMPKMSGLDFLRVVRTDRSSANKSVPIVMLTGNSDRESLAQAVNLGIHGFLAKPVSKAGLEKQIKRTLASGPISPGDLTQQGAH